MLSQNQVQEHLCTLRMNIDPKSPFYRMINFKSKGGLLSLPHKDQWQIFDAMKPDLKKMYEKEMVKLKKENER